MFNYSFLILSAVVFIFNSGTDSATISTATTNSAASTTSTTPSRPGTDSATISTATTNSAASTTSTTKSRPAWCPSSSFYCHRSDECKPAYVRCDGTVQCLEGEDEENCPVCNQVLAASTGRFYCTADNLCIPLNSQCDGIANCPSGEDESDCLSQGCSSNAFDCGDGQCIQSSWQCDTQIDCNNGADEESCGDICRYNQVKCNSTNECISTNWQCDGEKDCPDGEDELNCLAGACPLGRFSCSLSKVECIPQSWRCDGDLDCTDGTDEVNCTLPATCSPSNDKDCPQICQNNEFRCQTNQTCISRNLLCDGWSHCADGSDEVNCTSSCREDEFLCNNTPAASVCISVDLRCDGWSHCSDGSDEVGCLPASCGDDEFQCQSTQTCISKTLTCDNWNHCLDGSDEIGCNVTTTSTTESPSGYSRFSTTSPGVTTSATSDLNVNHTYYGVLIQNGWSEGAMFELSGQIYAVDHETIQIIGFSFSGLAKDATFLLGKNNSYPSIRCGDGVDYSTVTPHQVFGASIPLKSQIDTRIVLKLPEGWKLSDLTYIAVGGTTTKILYGGVAIPSNPVAPVPHVIGSLTGFAHAVRSGNITILDERRIQIHSFTYDGQAPDTFFYVGITESVSLQQPPYGSIPDENGISSRKLPAYRQDDIILTLPSSLSIFELKWLAVFDIAFSHNLGHVSFPDDLLVPPFINYTDFTNTSANSEMEVLRHSTTDEDAILLFTNRYNVLSFSLNDTEFYPTTQKLINATLPIALDFDYSTREVFFAARYSINKFSLPEPGINDSYPQVEVLHYNMRSEGLCYDWVYKNLYWTDTISDRIMISNAANVSKILYENSDPQCTSNQYLDDAADNVCIDEPRSIIAHPQMGWIFWTDWGRNPHIAMGAADGSSMQMIAYNTPTKKIVDWVNGLTIDRIDGNRLYWIDAKLKNVFTCPISDCMSNAEQLLASDDNLLRRPYAITWFQNLVYWTDWQQLSIQTASKYEAGRQSSATIFKRPTSRSENMDLKIFHASAQPITTNKCQTAASSANSLCDQICVPKAFTTAIFQLESSNFKQYTCLCYSGYQLAEDGRSCLSNA